MRAWTSLFSLAFSDMALVGDHQSPSPPPEGAFGYNTLAQVTLIAATFLFFVHMVSADAGSRSLSRCNELHRVTKEVPTPKRFTGETL